MPERSDQSTDMVVVGYDGSQAADGAVAWAAIQAGLTGARLDLVCAWEYPTSWGDVIPLPADYDPAASAQAMLDPVVERLAVDHPGLRVHTQVVEGRPGDALVEASRHADLLVVASRGHGSLSGLLLGSVSQHCVTHAACPVLVHRGPTED